MSEQTNLTYLTLGERLYEKTVKGQVRWKETADEQEVIVFLEGAALSLRREEGQGNTVELSKLLEEAWNISKQPDDPDFNATALQFREHLMAEATALIRTGVGSESKAAFGKAVSELYHGFIEIVVRKKSGEAIDRFRVSPFDKEWWDLFSKLHTAAINAAQGIGDVLVKLIQEIERAPVVGSYAR